MVQACEVKPHTWPQRFGPPSADLSRSRSGASTPRECWSPGDSSGEDLEFNAKARRRRGAKRRRRGGFNLDLSFCAFASALRLCVKFWLSLRRPPAPAISTLGSARAGETPERSRRSGTIEPRSTRFVPGRRPAGVGIAPPERIGPRMRFSPFGGVSASTRGACSPRDFPRLGARGTCSPRKIPHQDLAGLALHAKSRSTNFAGLAPRAKIRIEKFSGLTPSAKIRAPKSAGLAPRAKSRTGKSAGLAPRAESRAKFVAGVLACSPGAGAAKKRFSRREKVF